MDMQAVNERVVAQFRSGGPVDGMHRERLVLLTTTGRRSGRQRTAPMMSVEVDGDPLVIASAAGAPEHPEWLRNLRADPHAVLETPDGARTDVVAEELGGEERESVWRDLVAAFPFFAEHQERAGERVIPLVRLRACR
jgi:deazaflavin-dependent oxidoreductase (nitroreductase family)